MKAKIIVDNMSCAVCTRIVRSELDSINGVEVQNINVANKTIDVEYSNESDLKSIKEKLNAAGYPVNNIVKL